MISSRSVIEACQNILEANKYVEYRKQNIHLPQLLKWAALKAFQDNRSNYDTDCVIIRDALNRFDAGEYFDTDNLPPKLTSDNE